MPHPFPPDFVGSLGESGRVLFLFHDDLHGLSICHLDDVQTLLRGRELAAVNE